MASALKKLNFLWGNTYNEMVKTCSTDHIVSVTVLGWWAKSFLGSAMNSCYLEWIGSSLSLPNICISFLSYSLKYCSQNFLCLLIALSSTSTSFTIPFGEQIIYGMAKKKLRPFNKYPKSFLRAQINKQNTPFFMFICFFLVEGRTKSLLKWIFSHTTDKYYFSSFKIWFIFFCHLCLPESFWTPFLPENILLHILYVDKQKVVITKIINR